MLQPVEIDEGDRELAERLLAEKSPEDIAAMLVASHRAKLPEPEDLLANTPEARRAAQQERHRPGFEDTVWFRMDIGRRRNADPRWILPLLCRRGHITRNEIGAIRIGPNETFFQIPRNVADKFAAAVQRTAGGEDDEEKILIEPSNEAPRDVARENRRGGPPQRRDNARGSGGPGGDRPKVKPKPHRKGGAGGAKPPFKGKPKGR